VTGKPDGTALSIRIFPPGADARIGPFPMNGPQAGNVMTNAKAEAFDGTSMSLRVDGQMASITVPADIRAAARNVCRLGLSARFQRGARPRPRTFASFSPDSGARIPAALIGDA
jgi:hypothetical protein